MSEKRVIPSDRPNSARIIIISLMAIMICLAGLISFVGVRQLALALNKPAGGSNPVVTPKVNAQGTSIPGSAVVIEAAPIAPSTNPWDGAGRVTILLLGLDYRDWAAEEGPARSDTMILLTLDPLSKTAGMMSIPRDMWVQIPGFQHGKINTAYYLGDAYKLPGGGPALAVKTVEQFLGVPINYYAQIDFGAFVRFIDEIGGIKIDVPKKIKIDILGGGPETKAILKPGVQVIPGDWALAYARARYTQGGDFDRAQRQQQVILAIRERILHYDQIPTLISKAPTLYNELSSGINTNLNLDELIKLALLAQSIPQENIQSGIIGPESVVFGLSPDNLDILIPIPDKIHRLRDQLFTTAGGLGPETPGSAQEQMQAEGARIAVYNGSSLPGLADRTAEYLKGLGANIVQVAEINEPYAATTIIDHSGNPYALKFLVDLMHISPNKIYIRFDPNHSADIELFLGEDWGVRNPLP